MATTEAPHRAAEDEPPKREHGDDAEVEYERHSSYQRSTHSELEEVFMQVRDVDDAMEHRGTQYRDTSDEKNDSTNFMAHQD